MRNTELNKEILDILDNVIYWETCPKDYKVRIKAIKEQLTLTDVSQQRELLITFCKWYNQAIPSYETTEEETVDTYLRESN